MKLLTILRLSLFAIGTAKAYSAIDANGAVDGVFIPEAAVNVGQVADPGAVDCINGNTSSGQTCYEACNNGVDCCGPTENACDLFTGKVAKDKSCMGKYACYGGIVESISVGSCVGDFACFAGGDTTYVGSVGLISGGSCKGRYACTGAGTAGGNVGSISGGSCVGTYACTYAGSYNGSVGSISGGSCIALNACNLLGHNGDVGDLAGCCTTEAECSEISALSAPCSTTIQ